MIQFIDLRCFIDCYRLLKQQCSLVVRRESTTSCLCQGKATVGMSITDTELQTQQTVYNS